MVSQQDVSTVFQHISEENQNYIIHSNTDGSYDELDIGELIPIDIVFTRWGCYVMALDRMQGNQTSILMFDRNYNVSPISGSVNASIYYNNKMYFNKHPGNLG